MLLVRQLCEYKNIRRMCTGVYVVKCLIFRCLGRDTMVRRIRCRTIHTTSVISRLSPFPLHCFLELSKKHNHSSQVMLTRELGDPFRRDAMRLVRTSFVKPLVYSSLNSKKRFICYQCMCV